MREIFKTHRRELNDCLCLVKVRNVIREMEVEKAANAAKERSEDGQQSEYVKTCTDLYFPTKRFCCLARDQNQGLYQQSQSLILNR